MIVRKLEEAERTDRRVVTENWESTRPLLKGDGMGFSFHITTIYPGTKTHIWYKNHLESVFCIEGEGEVEILDEREVGGRGDGGKAGDERVDERREGEGWAGLDIGGKGGKIYRIAPGTIYILDRHDPPPPSGQDPLKLACVFNPPLHGKEVHDEEGVYPLDAKVVAD